jgi:hypothetical protein
MSNAFSDFLGVLLVIFWLGLGLMGWLNLFRKVGVTTPQKVMLFMMLVFLVPFGVATLLASFMVPRQKECAYCAQVIMYKARICPYCGREQASEWTVPTHT